MRCLGLLRTWTLVLPLVLLASTAACTSSTEVGDGSVGEPPPEEETPRQPNRGAATAAAIRLLLLEEE